MMSAPYHILAFMHPHYPSIHLNHEIRRKTPESLWIGDLDCLGLVGIFLNRIGIARHIGPDLHFL